MEKVTYWEMCKKLEFDQTTKWHMHKLEAAVVMLWSIWSQEDFHGALKKLLERYHKCIGVGGDYFEGDKSFFCVLSINVILR